MSEHAATIRRFWQTTEARDWEGLAEVLAPAMVYEMEQTRERIHGRDGVPALLRRSTPATGTSTVRRVVADADGGVSVVDFRIGDEQLAGITFFTWDDTGLIARVEDVWPEPYEPPADRAHLTERTDRCRAARSRSSATSTSGAAARPRPAAGPMAA